VARSLVRPRMGWMGVGVGLYGYPYAYGYPYGCSSYDYYYGYAATEPQSAGLVSVTRGRRVYSKNCRMRCRSSRPPILVKFGSVGIADPCDSAREIAVTRHGDDQILLRSRTGACECGSSHWPSPSITVNPSGNSVRR